ncbi:hypothetical protein E3N88_28051 [Mikania micrantha]|uniref:CCHC-type domain-containing protein n=1 Tax=Mikania micrantha TaxID=192012 RepID=A0A5N6MZJ8_9ASTR|nr:hypothetical protein E3N88_28051 [Mikania micrantha]
MAKECRSKPVGSKDNQKVVKGCYKCGKPEHWRRDCPQLKEKESVTMGPAFVNDSKEAKDDPIFVTGSVLVLTGHEFEIDLISAGKYLQKGYSTILVVSRDKRRRKGRWRILKLFVIFPKIHLEYPKATSRVSVVRQRINQTKIINTRSTGPACEKERQVFPNVYRLPRVKQGDKQELILLPRMDDLLD